jgi:hypothetical protein
MKATFDRLNNHPDLDVCIQDLCAGKQVQVDDGFCDLEPFAIYTVQATAGGRLFITNKKGEPFFFDEYVEETGGMEDNGGHLYAIYDPAVVAHHRRQKLN